MPPPSQLPSGTLDSATEARRLADALIKRADEQNELMRRWLARLERKMDILTVGLGLDGASPDELRAAAEDYRGALAVVGFHPVQPAEGTDRNPVFDGKGREIDYRSTQPVEYPLIGLCACGRQIAKLGPSIPWEHSD